jgi:hypothetical protein
MLQVQVFCAPAKSSRQPSAFSSWLAGGLLPGASEKGPKK